jgi:hypothetical protein
MLLPVCPTYCLLHVLHCKLYIPLFVYMSCLLWWCVCRSLWVVLLTWYAIHKSVFLNILVTFLIRGLWYSKAIHFLCVFEVLLSWFLLAICECRLSIVFLLNPLFLAIWWIVFNSCSLCSFVNKKSSWLFLTFRSQHIQEIMNQTSNEKWWYISGSNVWISGSRVTDTFPKCQIKELLAKITRRK